MNSGFRSAHRFCTSVAVFAIALTALVAVGEEPSAPASLSDRVLVVYDRNDGGSRDVAKYYAKVRGIPEQNLCSIAPIDFVRLGLNEYLGQVQTPVRKCLDTVGASKILYIVLSYNVPYRLEVPGNKVMFALDQWVADIWNQYIKPDFPGRPIQPYFDKARSKANIYEPFVSFADFRAQRGAPMIYSVWRLDAATPKLAKGLVDKAIEAEKSGLKGVVCIDRRWPLNTIDDSGYGSGDWDLHRAATFAREAGFKVIEDDNPAEFGTPPAPAKCSDAALYAGWYSLNNYNNAFTWNTGAIGLHLDSLSAWGPRSGPNWAANAIQHGITVTAGAVDEPGLGGLVHPSGTFRDLFQGANVGDAFLRNTAFLTWEIMYIGDPLYRPFPHGLPPFNGKEAKPEQKQEQKPEQKPEPKQEQQ